MLSESGSSNISADDWDITPTFFYAGRCQPSHLSKVTKAETGSRFATPFRRLEKGYDVITIADGPIWTAKKIEGVPTLH